jgi:hypothetical protein
MGKLCASPPIFNTCKNTMDGYSSMVFLYPFLEGGYTPARTTEGNLEISSIRGQNTENY